MCFSNNIQQKLKKTKKVENLKVPELKKFGPEKTPGLDHFNG